MSYLLKQHNPDMLDNLDNTNPIVSTPDVDYEDLSSKYDALLPFYSVRTNNVLAALQQNYASKQEFLHYFIRMSKKTILALKNCGAKTVDEILAIQSILDPDHKGQQSDVLELESRTLPANIDILLPLITPRLASLSVRAKNGFIIFLEDNHNSLTELHAAITNPKFDPVKMKNVGRNTAGEIMDLLNGIKEYLESFTDEQSVEDAVTKFFTKTLDDLQISADAQNGIHELENTLGHFPLFAAINAYIDGLQGEERAIISGLFDIYEEQAPRDRSEVAAELGLSTERVRQKRNKLLETLSAYFATYRTLGFVDKCPYNYQMRRINEDINAEEGTYFNLNFINWVLASVFEEITLLGDVVKTITGYYGKEFFLCLVPTDLCQYMDFNAFIEDVETRLAEKRINEEKVNLQDLINSHLKTQYCEDEMPAIETACRSILYLHYPVEVDFGQVIFKPNARKNNPIIVEEILRAAGHPLTLQELYDEFIYQYPERYTELNSFRSSVNANPNIIPIGRTSTYTLAEWEADGHKGGSIRSIIAEYLRGLEPTIAPMTDITEYVCQFRPTSSEYSILSNLSVDESKMFTFFFRDGMRYIGLSENTYPIEYFPYSGDARNAVAMSVGYPKLLEFLSANGRFPFSSGVDDDEKQLCGFWRRQQRYYEAGELSASGLAHHTKILGEFGHLQMDKKEYEWRQKYDLLWRSCFEQDSFDPDLVADIDLDSFTRNMLHDYHYYLEKLPEWKKEAIVKFMDKLEDTRNVQDNLG